MTPALVSFPRTGSHWLRLALELATGRPCEPDPFVGSLAGEPLLLHTHDLDLTLDPERSVYLWREDACAVVFSQLRFEGCRVGYASTKRVATDYAEHVKHWWTRCDLAVSFESMERDMPSVLAGVCAFLGAPVSEPGLQRAAGITRDQVARFTIEPRAVDLSPTYADERAAFRFSRHGKMVRRIVEDVVS